MMRLHFFNDNKNFGDQLNHWIWPQFFQKELRSADDYCLVGIGTILDQKIPKEPVKLVLGSGTGYARCAKIDEKWNFLAVRGPLTAAHLGLESSVAVTDSAALISVLDVPIEKRRRREGGVVFVPHVTSSKLYDWMGLCSSCGIDYLDPTSEIEYFLKRIYSAELVIAEAMHAAIIADTYRIPWIPVVIYPHINEFKWTDWCLSLGMSYHPIHLPPLYDSFVDERKAFAKWSEGGWLSRKVINLPGHAKMALLKSLFSRRISLRVDQFRHMVRQLCDGHGVMLSETNVFEARVSLLYEKVELIREIVAARY